MTRPRGGALVGVVLAGSLSVAVVAGALAHGWSGLQRQEGLARALDSRTATLDALIAQGRFAATHLTAERSRAAELAREIPPGDDDESILASVVSAQTASGALLADEQRGQAAPGGAGVVRVPVTVDVNGTGAPPLVTFAGLLQRQPRLFEISALELSTQSGATLKVTASVFSAPERAGAGTPAT